MAYNGCMAEEIERTEDSERVRKLIWRHMGVRSAREIAEMTGVPPETILRVKRELLEEVDVLSIDEKRQRIVVELDEMARDARDRAQGMSDEFYSSSIQAATGAMKVVLAELKRIGDQDNSKIEALNQKRIQELVNLVNETVVAGVAEIAATHGLNEDELLGVFNAKLIEAAEGRDLP